MQKAIIAKKIGMTQIFAENGLLIPVTVLEAGPCVVTQKKTVENDGYEAIQVGFGEVKVNKVIKPMKGHFDIKRHGQSRGPMGHGSKFHRAVGSLSSATTPGKVKKGKKMAGHMGSVKVTIQNLEVVRADADKNLLLIKGAVPGPKNAVLVIKNSVKAN